MELIILARNLTCIHHVGISLLLAVPDNHLSSIPLNSVSLSGVSFCGLTKYGYILLEKYYTQREHKSDNLTLSSGDSGTPLTILHSYYKAPASISCNMCSTIDVFCIRKCSRAANPKPIQLPYYLGQSSHPVMGTTRHYCRYSKISLTPVARVDLTYYPLGSLNTEGGTSWLSTNTDHRSS